MTVVEKVILFTTLIIIYLFTRFLFLTWQETAEAKRRALEEMKKIPRIGNYSQTNTVKHGKTKKDTITRSK